MKNIVRKIWKVRNRIVLMGIAGLACLTICDRYVASASDGLVYRDVSQTPSRPVALVLGTAKYVQGGRRNLFYISRIEAAAQLYKAGKVRAIVVSGDNGRVEYDEPSQMKADLVELGVPAEFITCDYAGFCTLDSVHRAERVFQESQYIVVSQEFHVRRALFIAADRGHDAVGYAVPTPGGYWGAKVRLREVLARVKAVLQVHALGSDPKYLGQLEDVPKRSI
jgi:SanA protein